MESIKILKTLPPHKWSLGQTRTNSPSERVGPSGPESGSQLGEEFGFLLEAKPHPAATASPLGRSCSF